MCCSHAIRVPLFLHRLAASRLFRLADASMKSGKFNAIADQRSKQEIAENPFRMHQVKIAGSVGNPVVVLGALVSLFSS